MRWLSWFLTSPRLNTGCSSPVCWLRATRARRGQSISLLCAWLFTCAQSMVSRRGGLLGCSPLCSCSRLRCTQDGWSTSVRRRRLRRAPRNERLQRLRPARPRARNLLVTSSFPPDAERRIKTQSTPQRTSWRRSSTGTCTRTRDLQRCTPRHGPFSAWTSAALFIGAGEVPAVGSSWTSPSSTSGTTCSFLISEVGGANAWQPCRRTPSSPHAAPQTLTRRRRGSAPRASPGPCAVYLLAKRWVGGRDRPT